MFHHGDFRPRRRVTVIALSLISICVLYFLLVVLPFFVYGMNTYSYDEIASQSIPHSPYFSSILAFIALVIAFYNPIIGILLSFALGVRLWFDWRKLGSRHLFLSSVAFLLYFLYLAASSSTVGKTIELWIID